MRRHQFLPPHPKEAAPGFGAAVGEILKWFVLYCFPVTARWNRVFLLDASTDPDARELTRFRGLRGEARQDAVAEVVANCLVAFKALVRRGKMDLVPIRLCWLKLRRGPVP